MFRSACIFILMALLPVSVLAQDPLRIATEGAYPPFNYLNESGELDGFDVDIAKALCQTMQRTCTFVAVPWDGIIDGLEAHKYDVIVASMSYTPDRAKRVEFTGKYYRTTSSYLARARSGFDPAPDKLQGKTIATQRDTVHAAYLAATYKSSITLALSDTIEQSFDLLVAGKADAVLCNSLTGLGFLKSPRGKDFDYAGDPLAEMNLSSTANIAVRKGEIQLRDTFDKALDTIRLNGAYDRINQKYFPFSIY